MPHEPDLGLGRPGAGTSLPAVMSSIATTGLSHQGSVCDNHAEACAGGLAFLDSFQGTAVRGLAEVDTAYRQATLARRTIVGDQLDQGAEFDEVGDADAFAQLSECGPGVHAGAGGVTNGGADEL